MSDDGWRARIRWAVVHPGRDAVLVARPDGVVRLPETELPGRVWTADPSEVLPGLRELLGADAVLLRCLDEDEDHAARVQRAPLVAVPRGLPALPDGMAWAGAGELGGGDGDAAVAARVATELGTGGTGGAGRPSGGRRRGPAVGAPRVVRPGRGLAAGDHGRHRPARHRPAGPGPGLGAVVRPAGPDRHRRRLVQGQRHPAPVRQRGRGPGNAVRAVR